MMHAPPALAAARFALSFSILAGISAPCFSEALKQPAFYDFTRSEIPVDWKTVEPPGAKVQPKDHLLLLECNAEQYAGVQLPLEQDFVTVTARIHDAAT